MTNQFTPAISQSTTASLLFQLSQRTDFDFVDNPTHTDSEIASFYHAIDLLCLHFLDHKIHHAQHNLQNTSHN